MNAVTMGDDAKAIGMLCTTVGISPTEVGPKPLGPVGWHSLSSRISAAGLAGPSALLSMTGEDVAARLDIPGDKAEQVAQLLGRAGRFTLELERIRGWGVWMVTQADAVYPRRLRERLGKNAPPVLFGCGSQDLLSCEGVAVVGSRNSGASLLDYAKQFGAGCAAAGLAVISGAARGVDEAAMLGSLDAGGLAMGVAADSLERLIRQKRFREKLLDGTLLLLSPYHPSRRFDRGAAMGRNKLIYCLAEAAVVVSCDARRGGTWAGAEENLKLDWVPLLVYDAADAPGGNRLLLETTLGGRSARPLSARSSEAVLQAIEATGVRRPSGRSGEPEISDAAALADAPPAASSGVEGDVGRADISLFRSPGVAEPAAGDGTRRDEALAERDAFLAIYIVLLESLSTPRKTRELAAFLGVNLRQMSRWLSRAEDRQWIEGRSRGYARTGAVVELREDEAALGVPAAESAQEFQDWAVGGVVALLRQGGGKLEAIAETKRLYGVVEVQAKDWVEKAQPMAYQTFFQDQLALNGGVGPEPATETGPATVKRVPRP
jgi:predicted Rossmann fold nucleotide-binding protein DprA/Smf involved in DNA uptake